MTVAAGRLVHPKTLRCRNCGADLHWEDDLQAWAHAGGRLEILAGDGKVDHWPDPDWAGAAGLRPWQWQAVVAPPEDQ